MDSELALEMQGITKPFRGVTALEDVDLALDRAEVLAICGENGAGKSTLMKILSGIHPLGSFTGQVRIDGEPVQFRRIQDSEDHGIAIIHQELALNPQMTIGENIFLGNEVRSRFGVINWALTYKKAAQLLARVGLDESPATLVGDLGVGQQQLVEIAKAFGKEPRILILDEPTSALTPEESTHLLEMVGSQRDQGIASILISHKLNEVLEVADRVVVLRDGRVVANLRENEISRDAIIMGMVGREMDQLFPAKPTKTIGGPHFRIESWSVGRPTDPSRDLIRDVSLEVRAGEILGICGLMGAGRTELFLSIFGHSFGTSIRGNVYVAGEAVDVSSVPRAVDAGLAYVPEDRKALGLHLDEGTAWNISLPSLGERSSWGVVDEVDEKSAAEKFRQLLSIKSSSLDAHVSQMSGGNQQKVVLSKWVHTDPQVLILDEPTRGIDVGAKYEIYNIIHDLALSGKAIVMISSEIPELLGVSDRIAVISEGALSGVVDTDSATPAGLMQLMTKGRF